MTRKTINDRILSCFFNVYTHAETQHRYRLIRLLHSYGQLAHADIRHPVDEQYALFTYRIELGSVA